MAYQRSHSIDEEGARVGNTGPDAFVPQLANEYVAADVGHGHNTSPHSSRVNYSSHTLPTSPGLVYDPTRQSTISSGGSRLSYVTFNTPAQAGTSITSPMRSHSSRFPRLSTTHEFCDTIDSSSSLHSPSSDHGEEGFWLSRGRSQTSRHSSTRQSSALHEDMIQHQKQLEYEHQRDLEQLQEDEPAPAQYVSSQDPPPIYKELGGT
ncbi:hypothetical protein BD410DRAFT_788502 [Rickenella mellea]|uniref:Uncharacterized protein n=1 Tax=Rickenella mellea TaxID=50990 RepID=A0A4Y7Q704_9AGAM|nr:hypothetical protein BD410DRAFT_788502 [Rickenella mellea]